MRRKKDAHFVYLLILTGEVVYVGLTCDLDRRLKQHQGKIYTSVVSFDVPDKYEGLHWERKWLRFFMPKYNWIPNHLLS